MQIGNTRDTRDSPQRTHFGTLDGLRGVAALVVLSAHACAINVGTPLFDRKYLAVNFFFMLSGFVVAFAYEKRLLNGFSLMRFYALRIVRLYPLLLAGTIAAAIVLTLSNRHFLVDAYAPLAVVMSGLCLPSLPAAYGPGVFPVNPPQWSLFFELVAYVVFGLFVPRLSLTVLSAATALCLVVYACVSFRFGTNHVPFSLQIFGAVGTFLLGVLLFRLRRDHRIKGPQLSFGVISAAMMAICAIPAAAPSLVDVAVVVIILPVLLLSGANSAGGPTKLMDILGKISYPVYILHWPVLQACSYVLLPRFGAVLATTSGIVFSVLFAWLMLTYFDSPVRAYASNRVKKSTRFPFRQRAA
jgi:peptidoglycan/LPS O-acetylase OafA/YrhL